MQSSEFDIKEEALAPLINKYTHLNLVIERERFGLIHTMKPQLDGKQICDLYGIKPGKAIKHIIDEQVKF